MYPLKTGIQTGFICSTHDERFLIAPQPQEFNTDIANKLIIKQI